MPFLFAFDVSLELGAIVVFAISTIVVVVWRSAIIVAKQDTMIDWMTKADRKFDSVEQETRDMLVRLGRLEERGNRRDRNQDHT